jgi:hypothetical protein
MMALITLSGTDTSSSDELEGFGSDELDGFALGARPVDFSVSVDGTFTIAMSGFD